MIWYLACFLIATSFLMVVVTGQVWKATRMAALVFMATWLHGYMATWLLFSLQSSEPQKSLEWWSVSLVWALLYGAVFIVITFFASSLGKSLFDFRKRKAAKSAWRQRPESESAL
jgi:hypothetical protein